MALMTACPQCQTHFKIVPDQLRLHNGLVRCGSCAHVFDASKALLSAPTLLPTTPASSESEAPVWKSKAVVQALIHKPHSSYGSHESHESHTPNAPIDPVIVAAPLLAASTNPQALPQLITQNSTDEHVIGATQLPSDWADLDSPVTAKTPKRGSIVNFLLCLVALGLALLAAVQLMLIARFALVSAVPAMAPFLTSLCRPFACSVQAARSLNQLSLDTLTLKRTSSADDMTQPAAYELQANVSNAGALTVLAPQLELTLTNAQTQTIARRVLTTAELGASTATIAGHAEWPIKINLRLDPQTAGFTGRLIGSAATP